MVLDPETVRIFFFRNARYCVNRNCRLNNNCILMIMILMNKVVRHILFVCLCSYTSIGNIWILILFVYRYIIETYYL